MRRLLQANEQLQTMVTSLQEHLDAIRDHAQREKLNRKR
jgi:hypothetical protein